MAAAKVSRLRAGRSLDSGLPNFTLYRLHEPQAPGKGDPSRLFIDFFDYGWLLVPLLLVH